MDDIRIEHSLAFAAMWLVAAPIYFYVFWTWFDFWRKHRMLTYTMMGATFASVAAMIYVVRRWTFAGRWAMPAGVRAAGWVLFGVVSVFGFVADRQIGFRIRSFTPFFERSPNIKLRTTGAYGVVRHPIYAAGLAFQISALLITGYPTILVAFVVLTIGTHWFTRQEEIRLAVLLDDPTEYDRYRERVPALFPRFRKSSA